jgi:Tol biopolymer transport system component
MSGMGLRVPRHRRALSHSPKSVFSARNRRSLLLAAACSVVGFCVHRSAHAANPIRLNGALVAGGDVSGAGLQFSPDGSRVLYLADQLTDGINEIFSVPSLGGTAVKLNGPLVVGGAVTSSGLTFSPDSSRVLYHGDQNVDELLELFSVPAAGGSPAKLNDTLVAGGDVFSVGFQFSPDSSRVVYAADETTDNVIEVYSVAATGGVPVTLNGPIVAGGDVALGGIQFSPNGARVLYVADQTADTVDELFSVPATGGAAVKLNGALVAGGDVLSNSLRFSPDSNRVLYVADQSTDENFEVFSVAATGGAAVKLNPSLVAGGDVLSNSLQFSPASNRVLYLADQTTDEVTEVFSVPAAGGTAVKLNGAMVAGGDVSSIGLQFTPNGTRVVYMADQTVDEVDEIFSVPAAGGTAVKLNGPLAAGGDVHVHLVSPDSTRVLYHADQTADEVNEIFSVPTAGGAPVKLNGPLVAGGDVLSTLLQFSPDSSRVLYRADQTTDGVVEVFIVPAGGGTAVKVNGPLVAGGSVSEMQFSPDGSKVLYLADQNTADINEVFVRVVRVRFDAAGGSWDSAANWDQGVTPDDVMQVVIDNPSVVTVTAGNTPRVVNQLRLGGGSGASVLELRSDAVISAVNGVSMAPGGVIRGDGVVDGGTFPLTIAAGAEIRSGSGERLRLSASSFTNQGRVEVLGTEAALAEIEFSSAVNNSGAASQIVGRNAILRFNGGLTNTGILGLSFGSNDVLGPITNSSGGKIIISGDTQATFYNTLTNNVGGTLHIGDGCTAVFFAPVNNAGLISGAGLKRFELGGSGLGTIASAGSTIVEAAASVTASSIREASLTVRGAVTITPNGSASGTTRLGALDVQDGGRLDLNDNKLIVVGGNVGKFTGGAYSGLTGLIASAYNFSGWDGPGITTGMPEAGSLIGTTTLAISTADGAFYVDKPFGGISVSSGDVLIMYTYAGDLNLDGRVDAQDYGTIDNFVQFPGTSGYANGDINYDGVIDAADYGIIDNTIQLQGPPIPVNAAALNGVSTVPEPGGMAVFAMFSTLAAQRRRRRETSATSA